MAFELFEFADGLRACGLFRGGFLSLLIGAVIGLGQLFNAAH